MIGLLKLISNTQKQRSLPIGSKPAGLALTPDGKRFLSRREMMNRIIFVDLQRFSRRSSQLIVGDLATPHGVTIDADGRRA